MRHSEWIAGGYFLYLLLPIWLRAFPSVRKMLTLQVLVAVAVIAAIGRIPATSGWAAVRDWAPGVYLLMGYWLSGQLFTVPNERLERWLIAKDRAWLGAAITSREARWPPFVLDYLELTYMLCYPLVPLTFGLLYFWTRSDAAVAPVAIDDFWSAVLLAVFTCYGLLPWLPSRPPRAFLACEQIRPTGLRRLNLEVLNRASIQVNTLPSGHVAAALAAALALGHFLPAAGGVIGLIALCIAVAAVVGRYHYAADAILGALTALVAFAISKWA